MGVEFESCGPVISEATLELVEARLGVELPDDYRTFLLRVNGGRPEELEQSTFLAGEYGETTLNVFLKIGGQMSDFETAAIQGWRFGGHPEQLIPIGYDGLGNNLYLDVSYCKNEAFGRVYYRANDDIKPGHEDLRNVKPHARMKGFRKIADSFTGFLQLMGIDEAVR